MNYIEKIDKLDRENSTQEEVSVLELKAKNLLNTGKYNESKECFNKAWITVKNL